MRVILQCPEACPPAMYGGSKYFASSEFAKGFPNFDKEPNRIYDAVLTRKFPDNSWYYLDTINVCLADAWLIFLDPPPPLTPEEGGRSTLTP